LPAGRRESYPQSRFRVNPANIERTRKAGLDLSDFFDACLEDLLTRIDAIAGRWAYSAGEIVILDTDKAAVHVSQIVKQNRNLDHT
jgi:hypothetical protein